MAIVTGYKFRIVNWDLADGLVSGSLWEGDKPAPKGVRIELIQGYTDGQGYKRAESLDSAYTDDMGIFEFRDIIDLDTVRSDLKTALGNELEYYVRAMGISSSTVIGESLLGQAGVEPPETMTWEQYHATGQVNAYTLPDTPPEQVPDDSVVTGPVPTKPLIKSGAWTQEAMILDKPVPVVKHPEDVDMGAGYTGLGGVSAVALVAVVIIILMIGMR